MKEQALNEDVQLLTEVERLALFGWVSQLP